MNLPNASVPVVDNLGVMAEPWYRALAGLFPDSPRASHPFVRGGVVAPAWYRYLSQTAAPSASATPINRDRTMNRAWYTYLSTL